GIPCNNTGNPLPVGCPPPPRTTALPSDWTPFSDRIEFETADIFYRQAQLSRGKIDNILTVWAASLLKATNGDFDAVPPFANHADMHNIIDSIPLGDAPWHSFTASYTGPHPTEGDVPSWMTAQHEIWYRNPRTIIRNMLANPDFENEFDTTPYRRYDSSGHRHYQNLFSGNWTWEQADLIAKDGKCNGAMFAPVILGSDKTTVSIATGQNDYYPLYISLGNVHNNVRRAHRNAVALLAFLAIPKCEKEYKDDADYRRFRRQLFHSSLATILRSLRPGMTTPEIARCPDGHFRRIIYGLAPYIADYPEQALVACIVQKWCPICIDHRTKLGGKDPPSGFRSRQHTEELLRGGFSAKALWDDYGIVSDAIPFTNDFPRADIHELIAGDLLHQMIKGAFKDHLVTWVGEYITLSNSDTPGRADEVMSEIDRRIAAVPTFPGLRHFYQGRDFKQWTGDDSKGLMKVYLPALVGLIPDEMVQAIASFLEFCYLARRDYHTEATLGDMEKHLKDYLHFRDIFVRTGVRPEGFDALPREHALKHYVSLIRKFGSLNGLCTSITESKHIKAIKE
ncbi:hypothetical protein K474DRAFT_1570542, partial [Panus rudis PR-1116 ss-1]